jgi:hypothetical protein
VEVLAVQLVPSNTAKVTATAAGNDWGLFGRRGGVHFISDACLCGFYEL